MCLSAKESDAERLDGDTLNEVLAWAAANDVRVLYAVRQTCRAWRDATRRALRREWDAALRRDDVREPDDKWSLNPLGPFPSDGGDARVIAALFQEITAVRAIFPVNKALLFNRQRVPVRFRSTRTYGSWSAGWTFEFTFSLHTGGFAQNPTLMEAVHVKADGGTLPYCVAHTPGKSYSAAFKARWRHGAWKGPVAEAWGFHSYHRMRLSNVAEGPSPLPVGDDGCLAIEVCITTEPSKLRGLFA